MVGSSVGGMDKDFGIGGGEGEATPAADGVESVESVETAERAQAAEVLRVAQTAEVLRVAQAAEVVRVAQAAAAADAVEREAAGELVAGWVEQARRARVGVALGDLVEGLKGWKTTPPMTPMTPMAPVAQVTPVGPEAASEPGRPSRVPVVSVTGALAAAAGEVEGVAGQAMWRLGEAEVSAALAWVGRLRTVLDRAEVALVGEAVGRGLPKDEGMSSTDWVVAAEGVAAPVPDPRRVAAVVAVADACRTGVGPAGEGGLAGPVAGAAAAPVMPGAEVFTAAFTAGAMGVEKAGTIARFAADVKRVGDPDCIAQDVALLVGAASDDAAGRAVTGKELRQAIGLATRLLTPQKDLERDEARQRLARSLTKTAGPTALTGAAGLSTYRMVLDAEGAAIIDTAVQALSEPVPDLGADGINQLDPRSAATRRADALLALVSAGVAHGTRTPTPTPTPRSTPPPPPTPSSTPTSTSADGGGGGSADKVDEGPAAGGDRSGVPDGPAVGDRAQVVVMIGYDQLLGSVPGAGITITGEVLSPAVVRRMACDARIIPMVLGGPGQVLDLGVGRRFFSPAQRLVIWRRDHHRTYPGCTIPAAWTNVHHNQWHSRGGPTTITNGALLCQRHHTLVHDRDLTATIDTTHVTWHT